MSTAAETTVPSHERVETLRRQLRRMSSSYIGSSGSLRGDDATNSGSPASSRSPLTPPRAFPTVPNFVWAGDGVPLEVPYSPSPSPPPIARSPDYPAGHPHNKRRVGEMIGLLVQADLSTRQAQQNAYKLEALVCSLLDMLEQQVNETRDQLQSERLLRQITENHIRHLEVRRDPNAPAPVLLAGGLHLAGDTGGGGGSGSSSGALKPDGGTPQSTPPMSPAAKSVSTVTTGTTGSSASTSTRGTPDTDTRLPPPMRRRSLSLSSLFSVPAPPLASHSPPHENDTAAALQKSLRDVSSLRLTCTRLEQLYEATLASRAELFFEKEMLTHELESLTSCLFEEANQMVAAETRLRQELQASNQQLSEELRHLMASLRSVTDKHAAAGQQQQQQQQFSHVRRTVRTATPKRRQFLADADRWPSPDSSGSHIVAPTAVPASATAAAASAFARADSPTSSWTLFTEQAPRSFRGSGGGATKRRSSLSGVQTSDTGIGFSTSIHEAEDVGKPSPPRRRPPPRTGDEDALTVR